MVTTRKSILALLLQLLVIGSITGAELEISSLDEPVSVAGEWRFRPGDDPAWAGRDFDDSQWDRVTVPSQSPEGYPGHSGMGWYRTTLQLDLTQPGLSDTVNNMAIMLGAVESAYEIYAGGQKLGGIGQLPPEASPRYNQHAIYEIPPTALNNRGELLLALRVWRYEGIGSGGASGPYAGPFLLGKTADLSRLATERSLVPNMLMATLYLAIGLYHLFIARRNPAMREFFWFGWFAIGLALYSMETSQWRFNLDLAFLWHLKIEYTALFLLPFLAIEVLCRIARIPLNRAMRSFKVVFLLFALVVAVIPTFAIHYLTLPYFQYLAAIWALYTASLMGWHAYRGNREAAALTALLLILLISLINDIFMNGALLGTATTINIVFAMTVLLMAVLMANHYTATLAKLEVSVEEHTADLRQSNRKLQEANAIKEQFLANMSHELRTPLNAIIGLTHLGLQTGLDDQQRDYLTKIDASAANLKGIIDSVLDFSKLQAGELQYTSEAFDLRRLLNELELAAREQLGEPGDLTISFDCDDRIPATLLGDARKLATVLRNLIGNGIKFTRRGRIAVTAEIMESTAATVRIRFRITDTGIGIAELHLEKLFEGFQQADNSFTRAYGGTGLGLATAQQLTNLMGGEIQVTSTEGEGSEFSFDLDFSVPEQYAAPAKLEHTQPEEKEIDLSPIRGALILVVDDSEINLQIASEILRQAGFRVDTASDGKQAVAMVNQQAYDCVLMDLQMPVMDGFTATESIRASGRHDALPVLAVTANFSAQDRARATRSGMNDHIPKPINPQQLLRHLLQWITPGDRAAAEPQAEDANPAPAELPEFLPGLRIKEGLNRVGGNSRLYLKLLKDLATDYLNCAERLKIMVAEGQTESASQLAHKLRGIANNLGADAVGELAGTLEGKLKNGEELTDEVLVDLEQRLQELHHSIEKVQVAGAPAGESRQLDQSGFTALLDQLTEEIAGSNPAAADTGESLLAGLPPGAPGTAELQALLEALDVFDFTVAAQHLEAARSALN
ncbi:MAG: response regulator [Gammaproteobacteria bacterium]|jgi:signal transduction histidine kinase/FixJ family two-component response regulator/HPt (histidine-containing phosphotransfer) domain-containing protein